MTEDIDMPDPGPNEDLKRAEERAKAEAAKLRAEADLLKAQTELAAANSQQPDPAVTASTAEKARLDAQKGVIDSRKALADAQRGADLAAAQAAVGTVTGGGRPGFSLAVRAIRHSRSSTQIHMPTGSFPTI